MDRSLFSTHFGVCLSVCLRWSRSRTCRGQMKKTGGGKTSWFVLMISLKEQKIKKIRSDAARESGRNIDKIHRAGEECGTFSYCDNLSHQLSLQLKLGRPPPSPVQFCQEGDSWRDGWKDKPGNTTPDSIELLSMSLAVSNITLKRTERDPNEMNIFSPRTQMVCSSQESGGPGILKKGQNVKIVWKLVAGQDKGEPARWRLSSSLLPSLSSCSTAPPCRLTFKGEKLSAWIKCKLCLSELQ